MAFLLDEPPNEVFQVNGTTPAFPAVQSSYVAPAPTLVRGYALLPRAKEKALGNNVPPAHPKTYHSFSAGHSIRISRWAVTASGLTTAAPERPRNQFKGGARNSCDDLAGLCEAFGSSL